MRSGFGLTRRRAIVALAGLALPAARSLAQGAGPAASAQAILSDAVEVGRFSLGCVAAVRDAGPWRVAAAGDAGGRPLDGATVFEIGSITKVFTALLLAEMAQRGEVALTDPVAKFLPPRGQPRPFEGVPITLADLASYGSGLPNMPDNIHGKDPGNPYADYTVEQMYEAVSGFEPQFRPGTHYEYANLGIALLGHALALHSGRSYEELVVERICTPLGMADTRITLTPAMQARLAPGHGASQQPVPNWDLPAVAGAGALRSTADDLGRFLDAAQGRTATPLAPAFAQLLAVRLPVMNRSESVGMGWFMQTARGDELVWKDGDTGGYSAFIGYSTHSGTAAILLSATSSPIVTPQIARHLINPAFPLPAWHRQIAIDPARLAGLAGQYALSPLFVLTVTTADGHLVVQATGQGAAEVFPESETHFFYRIVDAQITFELGSDGRATALVLHQNGHELRGERVP